MRGCMDNQIGLGSNVVDFTLIDVAGNMVSPVQYKGKKNLFLVLNRGFA